MNQEQPVCQRFELPDYTAWYLIREDTRNSLWLTPSQILALYQLLQSNLDQLTFDAAYTPDVTMYEWSPPKNRPLAAADPFRGEGERRI